MRRNDFRSALAACAAIVVNGWQTGIADAGKRHAAGTRKSGFACASRRL
jgi:hypothetical protein